jgi:hypothetical protein
VRAGPSVHQDMAFSVGDRVQARVKNDRLFYTGVVVEVIPGDAITVCGWWVGASAH